MLAVGNIEIHWHIVQNGWSLVMWVQQRRTTSSSLLDTKLWMCVFVWMQLAGCVTPASLDHRAVHPLVWEKKKKDQPFQASAKCRLPALTQLSQIILHFQLDRLRWSRPFDLYNCRSVARCDASGQERRHTALFFFVYFSQWNVPIEKCISSFHKELLFLMQLEWWAWRKGPLEV